MEKSSKMVVIQRIKKFLANMLFGTMKFVGFFVPRNKKTWFCIPNVGCRSMDLLNYTRDGILSFVHYTIEHHKKQALMLYLIYYDVPHNWEDVLLESCKNKNITIKFIQDEKYFLNKLIYYYYFYKAEYILSSCVMSQRFPMKLKTQTQICINYYNPFKSDLIHNPKCNNIDYVIMSSNIACQIDSIASHIPYERYRAFGLPKEDAIIKPRYSRKEIMEKLKLDDGIKKIILYTPTHRSHEKDPSISRNPFGYDGDYEKLNDCLIRYRAVLFIKAHNKIQKKSFDAFLYSSNIKQYEDRYDYTLYDVLPHTDLLITDYSSTVFDFMLTGRPIIYNFFDIDLYREARGFSYDPIELVCAGPIVKNKQEFEAEIERELNGKENNYRDKYEWVCRLTHAYNDGNASERIYSFIMQLMDKSAI
jgi:CDP-glycerol glycerophosphotransferase (TagB/SpsB family)